MIRIAVLGCGRIGALHAAYSAAHPRAGLAGVFDIHAPAAADTHADLPEACLAAGKPVLCQRPIDFSLDGAKTRAAPIKGNPPAILAGQVGALNQAVLASARRAVNGHDPRDCTLVTAIETGPPPEVGFDDGVQALVLAEAALLSAREGRIVQVSEVL